MMTATAALKHLNHGDISAEELVSGYLQCIAEREPNIQAWEYLDESNALQQAIAIDNQRSRGISPDALEGVAIAVKDIFATADMPTGWGTPIYRGRQVGYDAAVVERLRSAGAVIMGKTVTTEYAMATAGKTHNPHHLDHTPGGSSSGSAAAVAAGMVPLAIGSQTMGSILRPAAFCGVLGFKPSFGLISRYGALYVSREVDHVGIFARSVEDIALLCSVLTSPDGRDPDCLGWAGNWQLNSESTADSPPKIAFIQTHLWEHIEPEAQACLTTSAAVLEQAGAKVEAIALPSETEDFLDTANTLIAAGLATNHGQDYDEHYDQLSPKIRQWIEQGRNETPLAYAKARRATVRYSIAIAKILSEFDVILTPVTTGTAPQGLQDTGSPMFCVLWTLCGLPAISIPVGKANNGLPLAIQLVGRRANDVALLGIADWVAKVLE